MRLYCIETGRIDMDRRVIMPTSPPGERIVLPVPTFLIQTGAATVLIDTGMSRDALDGTLDLRPRMVPLGGDDAYITNRLATIGVRPADVTHVIATHFHFDHAGGLADFAHATIVAQRAAVEAARTNSPREQAAVSTPGLRWHLVDGDSDLLPGVRLIRTDGHVVGHQAVLVTTERSGQFLLAIDTIYSGAQLAADDWGAYGDQEAARASARRVQQLAAETGATLVYGHDSNQWDSLIHAPEFYE